MVKSANKAGFRGWYYFRMGWSTYFAFIFAAINTLTVTYYLAIENYPVLKSIFPSFEIYIIVVSIIGVPLLTLIGYSHFKRTQARRSEVDILMETQPYVLRSLVNSEILLKLNFRMFDIVKSLNNEKLSESQKQEIDKIHEEMLDFVNSRNFRNQDDINYFRKMIKK